MTYLMRKSIWANTVHATYTPAELLAFYDECGYNRREWADMQAFGEHLAKTQYAFAMRWCEKAGVSRDDVAAAIAYAVAEAAYIAAAE